MYALVWRYEVRDEHRDDFETTYAPDGEWARLFAQSGGWRGMELLRSPDGSYLTIDVWRSRADFDVFMRMHHHEYERLDRSTGDWTRCEHRLGEYQVVE